LGKNIERLFDYTYEAQNMLELGDKHNSILAYAESCVALHKRIVNKRKEEYHKQFEDIVYPHVQCVIICNKKIFNHEIKYKKDCEIPVYQFNTEFVPMPAKMHQLKIDYEMSKKINVMKQPLMWLLLNEYYPKYAKPDLTNH
jgi:hypothetical protein